MSRYIDYDAIDYRNDKMHDKSSDFLDGVAYMAQRIEEAPSIDIVRCKDCKHWCCHDDVDYDQTEFVYYCKTNKTTFKGNDFCSRGERKESE